MEQSATIGALAKALAEFQAKVETVTKDATNPYFKSKYATLESIVKAIRKPLSDVGLSYSQLPTGENGMTTILMHSSGEYLKSTVTMHPAKNDPQGQGSAITYMRRYALSSLLGIVTDEDDDGNEATKPNDKFVERMEGVAVDLSKKKTPFEAAKESIFDAKTPEQITELGEKISKSKKLTDDEKTELYEVLEGQAAQIAD